MTKQLPSNRNLAMGRLILVILVFSLVGIIVYRYYLQSKGGTFTNVPKELQINYIPSDFKLDLDEEKVLTVLANPQKNRKEFNQLVYDINLALLNHTAERMNLKTAEKARIESEYQKHHPYLRNLYYNDFLALKDTTSLDIQTWYESESTSSVDFLYEVASKYTCFLVSHVITSIIETDAGKVMARGRNVDTPCGVALTEALKPMMDRLGEKAAIRDISRSRGLMQERVERVLAQLITYEVSDKKAINKNLQTKIWGFTVSSSDIEISAISVIKVGFDLQKYFDVEASTGNKLVTVTLPQPEIISQDIYPRFEKLDIGWLREVESVDLNKSIDLLRSEFRRDAMSMTVMEEAKKEAANLMKTMFIPVVNAINKNYQLRVRFVETPSQPDFDDDFLKEQASTLK
jgi:hypothetical protein